MARYECIAVYILASKRNGTLYTGVTSNLIRRVYEHREGLIEGFTNKYRLKTLVWYELHALMVEAIQREKRIKRWLRKWKLALIEEKNPEWRDLYPDISGETLVIPDTHSIPAPTFVSTFGVLGRDEKR